MKISLSHTSTQRTSVGEVDGEGVKEWFLEISLDKGEEGVNWGTMFQDFKEMFSEEVEQGGSSDG